MSEAIPKSLGYRSTYVDRLPWQERASIMDAVPKRDRRALARSASEYRRALMDQEAYVAEIEYILTFAETSPDLARDDFQALIKRGPPSLLTVLLHHHCGLFQRMLGYL